MSRREPTYLPRPLYWAVAALVGLYLLAVVVGLFVGAIWCIWHNGPIEDSPIEQKVMLTWLWSFFAAIAVFGATMWATDKNGLYVRPEEKR